MMKRALFILMLALPLLGACEVMYDIAQDEAQRNCQREKGAMASQGCVKANSENCDDYEKRRQKEISGK